MRTCYLTVSNCYSCAKRWRVLGLKVGLQTLHKSTYNPNLESVIRTDCNREIQLPSHGQRNTSDLPWRTRNHIQIRHQILDPWDLDPWTLVSIIFNRGMCVCRKLHVRSLVQWSTRHNSVDSNFFYACTRSGWCVDSSEKMIEKASASETDSPSGAKFVLSDVNTYTHPEPVDFVLANKVRFYVQYVLSVPFSVESGCVVCIYYRQRNIASRSIIISSPSLHPLCFLFHTFFQPHARIGQTKKRRCSQFLARYNELTKKNLSKHESIGDKWWK